MSHSEEDNHQKISKPHDLFFQEAFANKKVAKEFLKTHLPADLLSVIDTNDLELQPRNFINAIRKESIVDVLLKTKIHGQTGYLYFLLEHQSKPLKIMPLRVLQYECLIMDAHVKKYKTDKLPMIYSMVIYHGKKPWKYSNDIRALVDAPNSLVDQYFLKPFHLLDLNTIDDEEMKNNLHSGLMEFALKHIFDRDILPWLMKIRSIIQALDRKDDRDYLALVLQYMIDRGETTDKKAFIEFVESNLSEEVGEKIMTIAEQFKEEGKLEGKFEAARKMLNEGLEITLISKFTDLPIEQIKTLKKPS